MIQNLLTRTGSSLCSKFLFLLLILASIPLEGSAQDGKEERKTRLENSDSPFVRRHAADLVDWHLWESATFEKAKKANKPIYVCVGYDSCHWCLRMQKESFQNKEIAKILNDNFINVIVDRGRRPVLDSNFMTYMNANQGQSGWPLNVWITPDGVPFSVGSYFPASTDSASSSLPEFTRVLRHIESQWDRFPEYINAQSKRDLEKLLLKLGEMDKLQDSAQIERSNNPTQIHTAAYESIATRFDPANGGFSNPFQFPQTGLLRYLAALKKEEEGTGSFRAKQALKMMTLTGESMANRGIFDHLEGGFHRYALDPAWEVPRFEKLLVSQASMADCYLNLYQSTGNPRFLSVARATLSFVSANLMTDDGLMHSGLHSDSAPDAADPDDVVEGYYYTWDYSEFVAAAGEDAAPVLEFLMDVRPNGNLSPGGNTSKTLAKRNVLRMTGTLADAAVRFGKEESEIATIANAGLRRLKEERKKRPAPAVDSNIVIAWNLLASSAFARVGTVVEIPDFISKAETCVSTILSKNYDASDGMLYHVVDSDGTKEGVYALDYAALINALIDLYEVTLNEEYLQKAAELQDWQIKLFWDQGCFFEALPDQIDDFLRLRSFSGDGAASTNAIAAFNLMRLSNLFGRKDWLTKSREIWQFSLPRQVTFPTSVPELLTLEYHLRNPATLVVVTGAADSALAKSVTKMMAGRLEFNTSLIRLGADTVMAQKHPALSPFASALPESPSVIVIRDGVPSSPMTEIAEIEAALSKR